MTVHIQDETASSPPGSQLGSLCYEPIPTYKSRSADSMFSCGREISCLRCSQKVKPKKGGLDDDQAGGGREKVNDARVNDYMTMGGSS